LSKFELSIFDPNTLLPHRAGIAGLALVLSTLEIDDAPISWEITEDTVTLRWDCSDKEALDWLLAQTYQINDGILIAKPLNLSTHGKLAFSQGVLSSFLQHPRHKGFVEDPNRPRQGKKKFFLNKSISLLIDPDKPEIIENIPILDWCYYLDKKKTDEAFDKKGQFLPLIETKGNHFPGLIGCSINGAYKDSPNGFLPLLFLPIACNYYRIGSHKRSYGLVVPEVNNLVLWSKKRLQLGNRNYRDFRSSSADEAGLRFLLEEQIQTEISLYKVSYCEVYQLGEQPWSQQKGIKQSVHRIRVSKEILELYQVALSLFPSKVRVGKDNNSWLALSEVLPWIAANLSANNPWYLSFYDFSKKKIEAKTSGKEKKIRLYIYERMGLISMTKNNIQDNEKFLLDAVQGAFAGYLRKQFDFRKNKLGRELTSQEVREEFESITDKALYRLQRPTTQQEFATALVDFLSQFRSKAARGLGREIYAWIHGEEWRKARDLTMLAIATYQGKKKDGVANSEEELVEVPDSDSVSEADDEGYEINL